MTDTNELNELTDQLVSGVQGMHATTARIYDSISSELASFLSQQRHLDRLKEIARFVDEYVDAYDTIACIHSGLCSDINKLSAAVANGDDGSRDALARFGRRNKEVFTRIAHELRETEYRRLTGALNDAIQYYGEHRETSHVVDFLSHEYRDLERCGAGSAAYIARCEELDVLLNEIVTAASTTANGG